LRSPLRGPGQERLLACALSACALLAAALPGDAQEGDARCSPEGAEPVRVVAIDENFDVALSTGAIATIPGLEFEKSDEARRTILAWTSAAETHVRMLGLKPDRWGRRIAAVYTKDAGSVGAPLLAVGERAIESGLALYRPDSEARACRSQLLAAEERARNARTGIWADPNRRPLAGSDAKAIASAPDGFTLVEGRISGIGDASGRVYLNFGKIRSVDLAIVVLKRNIPIFESRGVALQNLVGRRIRVRGLLDRRFGPVMEIADPDALELIADGAAERTKG
jgi:hypothetical protein